MPKEFPYRSKFRELALCLAIAAAVAMVQHTSPGIGAVKTRYRRPYTSDGRAAFPARNRPGVYQVKQGAELVYVGHSANDIYKALYRHFQQWNEPGRDRLTYDRDAVTVRVVYTNNGRQAQQLERAMIQDQRPRDNGHKYDAAPFDDTALQIAEDAPFTSSEEPAPF